MYKAINGWHYCGFCEFRSRDYDYMNDVHIPKHAKGWPKVNACKWDILSYLDASRVETQVILRLTLSQAKKLDKVLQGYWDDGPPDEGWASEELLEVRRIIEDATKGWPK